MGKTPSGAENEIQALTGATITSKGVTNAVNLVREFSEQYLGRGVSKVDKKMMKGVFVNGILNENPTFRLVLGMCPTIAVTTSVTNALGMGAAVIFVLMSRIC